MRFLADENFPGDAVTSLRSSGHDVLWIRTDAPGITDQDVLARSLEDARVLLTFDKDFGELRNALSPAKRTSSIQLIDPPPPLLPLLPLPLPLLLEGETLIVTC